MNIQKNVIFLTAQTLDVTSFSCHKGSQVSQPLRWIKIWYLLFASHCSQINPIWWLHWEVTETVVLWKLSKREIQWITLWFSFDNCHLQSKLRNHFMLSIAMSHQITSQQCYMATVSCPTFGDTSNKSPWPLKSQYELILL